jgi:quercetin dioxygenase-like cupin family protein
MSAALTVMLPSFWGDTVSAQEPPPPFRVTAAASMNYTDSPRQYDLMQTLLELDPGAAVPSHRINGRAIITVVSGEVTKVEEDGEATVFKAGQTYPESSGDEWDVDINNGSAPARLLVTFLLSPGVEPLLFNPNAAPSTAPGPKFVAVARTSLGTIPAQFTLSHSMFEVHPGFAVVNHTHDGWHLITHLTGSVVNIVNGVTQPGTFAHGPHDIHEARSTGSGVATAMSASVNPTGAPPFRPLGAAAAPAAPAIRPPATGDACLPGN